MTLLVRTVEDAIAEVVEKISADDSDVLLSHEAEKLVSQFAIDDPDELIRYLKTAATMLVRERLQLGLAVVRRRERKSVFDADRSPKLPIVAPFATRFAVKHNVWRRVGEMRRQDWLYLASQRGPNATASLADVRLAKLVAEQLPDDEVATSAVISETQFQALEARVRVAAEEAVAKFSNE